MSKALLPRRWRLWMHCDKARPENGPATRSSSNAYGCGIWPLQTGPADPMYPCCVQHDDAYLGHDAGTEIRSRAEVDRAFLDCCLARAAKETDPVRRAALESQARLYYRIVRLLGWIFW